MSRPLVILRPEPGCSQTLAAARERGLEATGAPLFAIEPVAWNPPDADTADALLVGSANVFRHGGGALDAVRPLPVWAVGDVTAAAARDAGFSVERTGRGGLQSLLAGAASGMTLLRLAGEVHVDLAPPAGVALVERVVYRAVPLPLDAAAAGILRGGAVVLAHSAEAARHLASECDRLAIARDLVAVAALGARIAVAAGPGWRAVRVAPENTDSALLALAADMCH
ncbi:uroporphyrinogen-III synthase [Tsuneonella sp. YG55]|uniref:Uroporphyrinogen-III synthase n=1 Tax=Tsuneonella litorea TaxID=2976475 RepID=A0A9X3A7Y8_9SPHN|nr:uroporphyrinogen-III synthase [Tsuneonella litorea]MCT2558931.1 uroporphyrinogen-III synthase [Tsuneonella litorea]